MFHSRASRAVLNRTAPFLLLFSMACGTDASFSPMDTVASTTGPSENEPAEPVRTFRLSVGESATLDVSKRQYQRFMRYSSSNPDVAEVSATGTIVGVSPGTATVEATFGTYVVVGAVEVEPSIFSDPDEPLFSLAPRSGVPLAVGASRQFWVYTEWEPAQLAAMGISFTATGGTITSMGVYTAGPIAGTFMVVAHCLCGLTDTATVEVSGTAAQLRELQISPKTTSIAAGAVQQFGVTANWSTGASTVPPVSYSATGGSVSALGRYTAPSAPGIYRVIVSHTGGVLKDTAIVTVAGGGGAAPDPGNPPPPTNQGGTGPGNGTLPFFQDDFESGERQSANGFAWTAGGKVHVRTDKAHGGSYALKFRFGPDPIGKDSDSEQRFNLGRNMSELWVEYYLYIPENFVQRSGIPANNKFFFLWANRYSKSGDQQVGVEFERRGPEGSQARVSSMSENYLKPGTEFTIRNSAFMSRDFITPAKAGRWHRIRIHYKSSSGSQKLDGAFEGWMDDELMWRAVNWSLWYAGGNNFVRQGYLMGWANTGYTEETSFFIDDVKFYDRDPGWR